jgi:hypothetical protein
MNDSTVATVALNEQVWRAWVQKGKLREQVSARRRRKIAGIIAPLALIAFAIFFLTART